MGHKRQRVWCLDDPYFIHTQLQGTVKHDKKSMFGVALAIMVLENSI